MGICVKKKSNNFPLSLKVKFPGKYFGIIITKNMSLKVKFPLTVLSLVLWALHTLQGLCTETWLQDSDYDGVESGLYTLSLYYFMINNIISAVKTLCICTTLSTGLTRLLYITHNVQHLKPCKNWVGHKKRTCLSVDNSAIVTCRKACNMSKVLECRQKGPNLHSKSFKYSLTNLPKSSLLLKLGICLHSHVHWTQKLTAKSPDLNSVKYSVWRHCNR